MVDFGGWDMPVEYSGIVREHLATRTAAGLFDVSHMGEIEVRGPHALDLVQFVTCNDAARLADGQAQYSGLMTIAGTLWMICWCIAFPTSTIFSASTPVPRIR